MTEAFDERALLLMRDLVRDLAQRLGSERQSDQQRRATKRFRWACTQY
ncbi:hypothetical protein [Xanthomonas sp. fls2-241-TYG-148]|nr:hypothetical protein [Xanthomonas sp. fls2-241-TYG-148]